MKRALQNSMKSHRRLVWQFVGLFAALAGTVCAQEETAGPAAKQATPIEVKSPLPLRVLIPNSTPEAVKAATDASRQIHFSVQLVVADSETLSFWMNGHSQQMVDLSPEVEDRATPGYIRPEGRQSLLTTLKADPGTSILETPDLFTEWGRTVSYRTIANQAGDSFFSLSIKPKEVGKGEIGLKVTTRLKPDPDETQITGPVEQEWDVRSPMNHTLMFPMADVEPSKIMFLLINPNFAGSANPHEGSPFFASRISDLSYATRMRIFFSGEPKSLSQSVATEVSDSAASQPQPSERTDAAPPTAASPSASPATSSTAKEAAVLQMLVLDVDSKIADDVLSKTRTFESDQTLSDAQQKQVPQKETTDDVKEAASTSRSFTMDATLGKLFVADLRKQDESFKVISRPKVRSLIGVAAALDIQGVDAPGKNVAGVGSLKIHVTPKRIDDELAIRTWLSLSQRVKPSPDSDGGSGPKIELESTVTCPLGGTAVMVLGNSKSERAIILLTDVVSVQSIQPSVAAKKPAIAPAVSERPRQSQKPLPYAIDQMPDVHAKLEVMCRRSQSLMLLSPIARVAISHPKIVDVRQETPQMISLHGLKPGISTVTLWADDSRHPVIYRVEVLPGSPVIQASGVRQSISQPAPKSEVQQVLDEVREMRKLIQGLRDDMSVLRESVKQPQRKTSPNDIWIHQSDSQVFARGRKITQVSGHDPAVVEVRVLAPDRLYLTGKKPGRTTLKCLFDGDTVPESFVVEVFAAKHRSTTRPAALVPHAADHLPARRFSKTNPASEPVAVQRGPQTDIRLRQNDVYPVKRDKSVARIVLGSSSIVRVAQHSSKEFVIIGVEPGHTSLLVWSDGEADPELFQIMVLPTEPVVSDDNALSLTDSPHGDSARRLIEEALKKKTSIDIEDGTLLDAIRQLHETAGVNIAVDTRALEEEGVSTDARVSIHVAGVSLRSVLKLLLTEHNLAVLIEDEVLKVTSKQRAEGRQTVVAYRVAEFVEQSPDGQASFGELISLITTVVEPDSWQEVGGNGSVASNVRTGALVIRQTQDVHEQIQQLLSALRNWTKTASGGADSPNPIAVGVDELNGGRFSGFAPIENTQPSSGVQTPSRGPISRDDDSLSDPARPPGNTGAPIEAR